MSKKKVDTGTQSKTSRRSSGKTGGQGRVNLCPKHGTPLVPAILIPWDTPRRDGWICGAKGVGNVVADGDTHYLTKDMEEWL